MSHKQVISAYGTVPFGFLISIPKAVRILLVHRILETSFQLFLVKWACILFAVLVLSILRIQSFADVPSGRRFCSRYLPLCVAALARSWRHFTEIRFGRWVVLRTVYRMPRLNHL